MTFTQQHAQYVDECEKAVVRISEEIFMPGSNVSKAAAYALLNGGKRVRGVLTLAVCDLLQGNTIAAQSFATALEMIHAFSLVHDDLPCMDDDDVRRGKPSTHIKYGEDTALLAGDLLAIQAFEAIAACDFTAQGKVDATLCLAQAAGAKGMIYGQELDLRFENTTAQENELYEIHRNKTGALLIAAANLGIIAAGKTMNTCPAIEMYAKNIGLVFQIVDDILDVTADETTLGKPVGSDIENGKTTFVSLFGIDAAKQKAENLTGQAVDALREAYGQNADFLCDFALSLVSRIN